MADPTSSERDRLNQAWRELVETGLVVDVGARHAPHIDWSDGPAPAATWVRERRTIWQHEQRGEELDPEQFELLHRRIVRRLLRRDAASGTPPVDRFVFLEQTTITADTRARIAG